MLWSACLYINIYESDLFIYIDLFLTSCERGSTLNVYHHPAYIALDDMSDNTNEMQICMCLCKYACACANRKISYHNCGLRRYLNIKQGSAIFHLLRAFQHILGLVLNIFVGQAHYAVFLVFINMNIARCRSGGRGFKLCYKYKKILVASDQSRLTNTFPINLL